MCSDLQTIPASMASNYSFQLASSDEDNAIAVLKWRLIMVALSGSNNKSRINGQLIKMVGDSLQH
ncbi:hypothetical protein ACP5PY_24445 [Photobacterium leiognathi subsp. mandapamensis]